MDNHAPVSERFELRGLKATGQTPGREQIDDSDTTLPEVSHGKARVAGVKAGLAKFWHRPTHHRAGHKLRPLRSQDPCNANDHNQQRDGYPKDAADTHSRGCQTRPSAAESAPVQVTRATKILVPITATAAGEESSRG